MEPNITLIWFVQPQWFQRMGAFARRENIPVFVEWCETAFKLFGESPQQSFPAGIPGKEILPIMTWLSEGIEKQSVVTTQLL